MKITETETLYSKKGRRYVPTYSLAAWNYEGDLMPVGSFRLVHAYSDGGRHAVRGAPLWLCQSHHVAPLLPR